MPSRFFALLAICVCAGQTLFAQASRERLILNDAPSQLHAENLPDLWQYIRDALKSGQKEIVVPPGRYRVHPQNGVHMAFQNLADVRILADGVEMICTETTRAISFVNCRNVTLRGLTIDYAPLPYTQGRITAISPDKRDLSVELFDGYPSTAKVDNSKFEIFAANTRTLRTPDYNVTVEKVDDRRLLVHKAQPRPGDAEQVGDIVVIGSADAPGGYLPHGVVSDRCVNLRLENITLYASNCFGFLEYDCNNSLYWRCKVDRRPASTDPVRRADPRIRSANADAFHSKTAVKGPSIIECTAQFQGDDCVNICGDYHMVTASDGPTLRVLAKNRMNIAPGDPVELLDYNGSRLPNAQAVSVEPDGKINEQEKEFLSHQRMDGLYRKHWNADAYRITLDRSLPLHTGALICSARHVGNGFLVKDCAFGFNRSRGILIKASNGQVIGNRITGNWMAAILIAPEYWWLEAGSSDNLLIQGNEIDSCADTAIVIDGASGSGERAPAGAHNNIVISKNRILRCASPAIQISSTDLLKIEENSLSLFERKKAPSPEPIVTRNCTNVTIHSNAITKEP